MVTDDELNKSIFRSRGFREGVLVALVPAFGYAVAYSFALGRARDLGMPDQFIWISLPDVFRSIAAVIGPLVIVYFLFALVSHSFASAAMTQLRAFRVPITVELISIVFLHAGQASWHWWAWTLGLESFLLLVYVVEVLIRAMKGEGTFRSRFGRLASTPESPPNSVLYNLLGQIGVVTFLSLLAIALLLGLSYASGWGSASNQQVFFQKSGSDDVLVAIDGSNYVLESHNGHQLSGDLTLIPMSREINLRARKIGPLWTPKLCEYVSC
jgi:hypothetical protein